MVHGGEVDTIESITLGGDGELTAQFVVRTDAPLTLRTVRFDGTSSWCTGSDRITEYLWDFGDHSKSIANSALAEHNFPQAGVFDVQLVVRTLSGLEAEITRPVRIGFRLELDHEPRCPLTAKPVRIVARAFVNLDADDEIVNFAWDLDGSGSYALLTSDGEISHSFDAPGLYTVRVRATNINGIVEDAERTITIHELTPVRAASSDE